MRQGLRGAGKIAVLIVVAVALVGAGYVLASRTIAPVSQSRTSGSTTASYDMGGVPAAIKPGAADKAAQGVGGAMPTAESVSPAATATSGQVVVRTGAMELRVTDAEKSLAKLRTIAAGQGGEVTDANLSSGAGGQPVPLTAESATPVPSTAWATIRVPAENLDALVKSVSELGTVVSVSVQASDVTEQAIDLEARLTNLRAEEVRLRELLDRAVKVEDVLAVDRELARVRGEVESLDAQLTYLKRQAARATLTVTLSEPAPITGTQGGWRLREAIAAGFAGAQALLALFVTAAIAISPLLLIGLLGWAVVRLVRKRRSDTESSEAPRATDEPDTATRDDAE